MDASRLEREAFEKWGATIYPFKRHDFDADIYAEPHTQAAWEAWQQAWRESRAALAAQPAQADGETDIEWLLRQMETQDLATLRGIAKSFPCERNGCSPDKPAQAGEAVAFNEDVEREQATDELARECFDGPVPPAREADAWIDGWLARARHAHPTPRAEAAPSHTDLMVTPESVGPYVAAEAYAQGVIDGQQHERALAIAPASAEAVAREAADLLAEMDAAWPPSQPPPHPKSFQGRFQARVRAVAHALRVRGGR